MSDEAENVLKYLVAGDHTSFNRKFKDDITAEPTAKIMIATNAKPRFSDKTSGVWRRILLVPFDKVIPENEQDKILAEQLKTELPGILNWALEGLFDLNAAGGFSMPADSKNRLEIYRQEPEPARAFLTEKHTLRTAIVRPVRLSTSTIRNGA
ncbi:MAG: DUF5906 domain-containing protein [Planctomycetota bacterium]